jgi:hypothetical protein
MTRKLGGVCVSAIRPDYEVPLGHCTDRPPRGFGRACGAGPRWLQPAGLECCHHVYLQLTCPRRAALMTDHRVHAIAMRGVTGRPDLIVSDIDVMAAVGGGGGELSVGHSAKTRPGDPDRL